MPTGVSDLGPKVGQIVSKWDKSKAFSDQISVHFGSANIGFVLLVASLTHFGAKYDIPVAQVV